MTDVPSLLGIEAVECLAEGERSVTIRVTGRWRRRRPELRGQPMLVVDTAIGRQRFLAMPEPPSLTGAAPGTWRMSFSVPAGLAPSLRGRTFLQLGGAMVPLPIGDVPTPAPDEGARRPETEPPGVARLERALDEAHAQSDRLRAEIADRERMLRSAEQHVHSERALRAEVEEQLNRRSRAAQQELAALHERVAELERELARMRRTVDEAQHLAAAAEAARADAVRRLAERVAGPPPSPSAPPAASPPAQRTRHELDLARGSPEAPGSPALRPPNERAGDRVALRQEAAMSEHRGAGSDAGRIAALERELVSAYEEIEAQRRRSTRAYEAIALVRADLSGLRAAAAATQPTAPPQPARTVAAATAPIQAEDLSAALARLREQAPPPVVEAPAPAVAEPTPARTTEPTPTPTATPTPIPTATQAPTPSPPMALAPLAATRPWLSTAFGKLAAQDASAAGRLLLALVPAQYAADPHPIAYDLVMSDVLVAHVTVGSGGESVEFDATARPLSQVDFQLVGGPARIARLLAAGPVRRRLGGLAPGGPVARVRGDRRRLAALDALLSARLTLAQLSAAGVRLDPVLALTLVGQLIEPSWTAGEQFALAHREPAAPAPDAYLLIRDGRPPLASSEPPREPLATALVCPSDQLLAVLGGAVAPAEVVGDRRPLALLGQWLHRAQCG
jgi:hypothetical protein